MIVRLRVFFNMRCDLRNTDQRVERPDPLAICCWRTKLRHTRGRYADKASCAKPEEDHGDVERNQRLLSEGCPESTHTDQGEACHDYKSVHVTVSVAKVRWSKTSKHRTAASC